MKSFLLKMFGVAMASAGAAAVVFMTGDYKAATASFAGSFFAGLAGLFHTAPGGSNAQLR